MPIEVKIPPATTPPAQPTPVKRDFNDIDALISETLNQPKQHIGPQPGETPAPEPGANKTFQPVNQPNAAPWDNEPPEPLDAEAAKRSGIRIAKTLDGALSWGAVAYAKEKDRKKYQASDGEISDLAEPLSELSTKYNFELSPEVRLLFLVVTIYGPKFMQASNDRKINQLNEKIADLQRREREQENRLRDLERKSEEKEKELSKTEK